MREVLYNCPNTEELISRKYNVSSVLRLVKVVWDFSDFHKEFFCHSRNLFQNCELCVFDIKHGKEYDKDLLSSRRRVNSPNCLVLALCQHLATNMCCVISVGGQ